MRDGWVVSQSDSQLLNVAEAFHGPGSIRSIQPLGSGNVNDTFLVEVSTPEDPSRRFSVLQRINTSVFQQPELVMRNLQVLCEHVEARLNSGAEAAHPLLNERRWELPQVVCTQGSDQAWHCCPGGGFWRSLSFVADAATVNVIENCDQARELGIGLGLFHHLISDLPVEQLADTLEGFHITPRYLEAYHHALVHSRVEPCADTEQCIAFIREREGLVHVLEDAKQRGDLPLRPIHGDPKINNVMLDRRSGQAVALVDLDTVKPGLVHYDIGDCLRSCCNRLGEETTDLANVRFDLELAAAILEGYFSAAGDVLRPAEIALIPDAARLISFELGLRFFSDHLSGDTYFKASHPGHNLQRALVQFRLAASIEAQLGELRALVDRAAQRLAVAG